LVEFLPKEHESDIKGLIDSLEVKVGQGKVLHISKSKDSQNNFVLFRSEDQYEPYDTIRNGPWSD
jgi:hypothetical protein